MSWQPIETAPKDGTWVLLTGGKDDYNPTGPCVVAFYSDSYDGQPEWNYAYWDCEWRSLYENPTHWMPLLEQPK